MKKLGPVGTQFLMIIGSYIILRIQIIINGSDKKQNLLHTVQSAVDFEIVCAKGHSAFLNAVVSLLWVSQKVKK